MKTYKPRKSRMPLWFNHWTALKGPSNYLGPSHLSTAQDTLMQGAGGSILSVAAVEYKSNNPAQPSKHGLHEGFRVIDFAASTNRTGFRWNIMLA